MGIALAEAAAEYGADVDLVLGPVKVQPKNNKINIVSVISAESMADECISRFTKSDIAILAAAVADFTLAEPAKNKIKRTDDELILHLKPTRDIAAALGRAKRPDQILAGFALETHNEIFNASAKLERKNLDLIVLNSMQDEGAGFEYDTNKITIIDRNNNIDKFELKSKEKAARDILDKIVVMLKS